jgi:hypothetical protein
MGAGGDAADATGFAPVEVESELVEVGGRCFGLTAPASAEQPTLQETPSSDRPAGRLAPFGLDDSLVRPLAEAFWRARRSQPGCPMRFGCRRMISTCLHRCCTQLLPRIMRCPWPAALALLEAMRLSGFASTPGSCIRGILAGSVRHVTRRRSISCRIAQASGGGRAT